MYIYHVYADNLPGTCIFIMSMLITCLTLNDCQLCLVAADCHFSRFIPNQTSPSEQILSVYWYMIYCIFWGVFNHLTPAVALSVRVPRCQKLQM